MERKMKDSGIPWIGVIPSDWNVNKINQLFSIIGSGTTPKATNDSNFVGNINWIQSGDINGGFIVDCKNKIAEQVLSQYSALKLYKQPFIIVAMYGASVGNISISKIDGCVNQACCVMGKSNQYFEFLFYAIKSAKDYLIYRAEGGGQPNISQDKLKNLRIPLPPLPTQQRIADFLDRKCAEIDELAALQETMIAELKRYKQSVITEAVTKGLDPNVPMQDSGVEWIGKIPEGWEMKKIKQEFIIIAGATPKSDDAENWDGDIPWITPADYTTGQIYVYGGKRNLSPKGYDSCSTSLLPQGSLIFSKRAPIGLVAINAAQLCTNQGCLGCVPKDSVFTKFVYYTTSVWTEQFELYGSGTTFKEISANNFANFKLAFPPLAEQRAIADYLDRKCAEIDELIAIKQQKIEALKEYKKSVIFEYVTGKKEVEE